MRLYITGDTHGSIKRFFPEAWNEKGFPPMQKDDCIVILGDFGIPWETMPIWDDTVHESLEDKDKLDFLSSLPPTFLFIDGNHENFDLLYSYPVELWEGGNVHRLRSNVLHLMRGEVFNFHGLKFFAFGGARSIDRKLRLEGVNWWPQEIPLEEEMDKARENLSKAGNTVDLVFSHAAPLRFLYPHRRRLGFDPSVSKQDRTVDMLSELESILQYRNWYFGHYHEDFFDGERSARWMYRDIDWVEWYTET